MKKPAHDLSSKLSRARGLGSAHDGVHHWWLQRLTAVALIPLFIWFTTVVLSVFLSPDVVKVTAWFSSPLHALLLAMMVIAMFYHAKLGLQVVVEDYIHEACCKYTFLIANNLFCFAGGIICLVAIMKLHLG